MNLQMTRMTSLESWRTPYDEDTDGFNPRWWLAGSFSDDSDDWWSFNKNGIEVARVLVSDGTIKDAYENIVPPARIKDITFFEVRAQYRRNGIGRESVQMLVDHYKGEVLTAFSAGADTFWNRIGFMLCPRKDGEDKDGCIPRRYDPLFAHDDRL